MIAAQVGLVVLGSLALHVDETTDVTDKDAWQIVQALSAAIEKQTGLTPAIDPGRSPELCIASDTCVRAVLSRTGKSEGVFVRLAGTPAGTTVTAERTAGGGAPPVRAQIDLPRQPATWPAFLQGAAILLFPEGQNITPPIVAVVRPGGGGAADSAPIPRIEPKARAAPPPMPERTLSAEELAAAEARRKAEADRIRAEVEAAAAKRRAEAEAEAAKKRAEEEAARAAAEAEARKKAEAEAAARAAAEAEARKKAEAEAAARAAAEAEARKKAEAEAARAAAEAEAKRKAEEARAVAEAEARKKKEAEAAARAAAEAEKKAAAEAKLRAAAEKKAAEEAAKAAAAAARADAAKKAEAEKAAAAAAKKAEAAAAAAKKADAEAARRAEASAAAKKAEAEAAAAAEARRSEAESKDAEALALAAPPPSSAAPPGLSAGEVEASVGRERSPSYLPWVVLGGTVAAVAVATGLGIYNQDLVASGKVEPDPVVRDDYQDRVFASGLAANVLFGTAVVGAVTSALLFVMD